jgi:hypothetical protein
MHGGKSILSLTMAQRRREKSSTRVAGQNCASSVPSVHHADF